MKLSARLLAIALSIGIVGAPALADSRHDDRRQNGRHDNGRHNGWHKQDRRYQSHDRRYRGHRGRRVCRTERRHGERVTRCYYR